MQGKRDYRILTVLLVDGWISEDIWIVWVTFFTSSPVGYSSLLWKSCSLSCSLTCILDIPCYPESALSHPKTSQNKLYLIFFISLPPLMMLAADLRTQASSIRHAVTAVRQPLRWIARKTSSTQACSILSFFGSISASSYSLFMKSNSISF